MKTLFGRSERNLKSRRRRWIWIGAGALIAISAVYIAFFAMFREAIIAEKDKVYAARTADLTNSFEVAASNQAAQITTAQNSAIAGNTAIVTLCANENQGDLKQQQVCEQTFPRLYPGIAPEYPESGTGQLVK